MSEEEPSQIETTVWEDSAECTLFILAWNQKAQTKRPLTIFDVLRDELIRRAGLRGYGIEMKSRPRVAITSYQPKLLSNDRAA